MNTLSKKIFSTLVAVAMSAPMGMGLAFAAETEVVADFSVTQACISARTAFDDATIIDKTAQTAAEITAIRAHKAALLAAAALTDTTAKKVAFKKAETDLRTAMKATMEASRTSMKAAMDAVKTACNKGMMKEQKMNRQENGKKGFMNSIMRKFGRNKMKGNMMK